MCTYNNNTMETYALYTRVYLNSYTEQYETIVTIDRLPPMESPTLRNLARYIHLPALSPFQPRGKYACSNTSPTYALPLSEPRGAADLHEPSRVTSIVFGTERGRLCRGYGADADAEWRSNAWMGLGAGRSSQWRTHMLHHAHTRLAAPTRSAGARAMYAARAPCRRKYAAVSSRDSHHNHDNYHYARSGKRTQTQLDKWPKINWIWSDKSTGGSYNTFTSLVN